MNNIILEAMREDAEALVRVAEAHNCVVTIFTVPDKPLVMGNYRMVVDVRPRLERHIAKPLDIDSMCDEALARVVNWIEGECKEHSWWIRANHRSALRENRERHWCYMQEHQAGRPPQTYAEVIEAFSIAMQTNFRKPMVATYISPLKQ